MHHYAENELEKYRDGNMNFFQKMLCRIHLWHCPECSGKLNALDEDELILTDLRKSMAETYLKHNDSNTYNSLCEHFKTAKGSSTI